MRPLVVAVTLASLLALPVSASDQEMPEDPLDDVGIQPADPFLLHDDVPTRDLFRGYVGTTLGGGNLLATTPLFAVVSDPTTLDTLYAAYLGTAAPIVDFNAETVYFATSGERSMDCGFGIQEVLAAPVAAPDEHVVRVFGATQYTGSLLCFQVVNIRAHVVAVPSLDGVATFHDALTHAVVGAGAA